MIMVHAMIVLFVDPIHDQYLKTQLSRSRSMIVIMIRIKKNAPIVVPIKFIKGDKHD